MSFTNVTVLWAGFLLVIPLVIHLFGFRRVRKVVFTNVRFLQVIGEEKIPRSKLKQRLLLMSRLLALAFLVLTFSGPVSSPGEVSSEVNRMLIFDNSPNMAEPCGEQACIESMTKLAQVFSDYYNSGEVLLRGRSLETFYGSSDLTERIERGGLSRRGFALPSNMETNSAVIVSDFERTKIEDFEGADSEDLLLIPLHRDVKSNLFVDSVYMDVNSGLMLQEQKLVVVLRNAGSVDLSDVLVKLMDGKRQVSSVAVQVPANLNQKLEFELGTLSTGKLRIVIEDRGVVMDNEFFVGIPAAGRIRVALITDKGDARVFEDVFGNAALFDLVTFGLANPDFDRIFSADLVILNGFERMPSWVDIERFGGDVVVVPTDAVDLPSYSSFLGRGLKVVGDSSVDFLDVRSLEHPFFANIFDGAEAKPSLPNVTVHYDLSGLTERILFGSKDFLERVDAGGTYMYLFNGPIVRGSDVVKHAIFLPLMYRIAEKSMGTEQVMYYRMDGRPIVLRGDFPRAEVFRLTNEHGTFIPEVFFNNGSLVIRLPDELQISGLFALMAGKDTVDVLALNHAKEVSFVDFMTDDELLAHFGEHRTRILDTNSLPAMNAALADEREGKRLWKYALLLTLMFLIAEIAIHRWVK